MIRLNNINYDCFVYRLTKSETKRGPLNSKVSSIPQTIFEVWFNDEGHLKYYHNLFNNRIIDKNSLKLKTKVEKTSQYGRYWQLNNGEKYQEYIMGFVSLNQNVNF